MDWQQPAALFVVAFTVLALIRRTVRDRGKECPGSCSCPARPTKPEENRRHLEKPAVVSYLTEDKGEHS